MCQWRTKRLTASFSRGSPIMDKIGCLAAHHTEKVSYSERFSSDICEFECAAYDDGDVLI